MKLMIAIPNNIHPKPILCTKVPLRAGPVYGFPYYIGHPLCSPLYVDLKFTNCKSETKGYIPNSIDGPIHGSVADIDQIA